VDRIPPDRTGSAWNCSGTALEQLWKLLWNSSGTAPCESCEIYVNEISEAGASSMCPFLGERGRSFSYISQKPRYRRVCRTLRSPQSLLSLDEGKGHLKNLGESRIRSSKTRSLCGRIAEEQLLSEPSKLNEVSSFSKHETLRNVIWLVAIGIGIVQTVTVLIIKVVVHKASFFVQQNIFVVIREFQFKVSIEPR
jgi:hypothetical protein